jgi:hypothetical protein
MQHEISVPQLIDFAKEYDKLDPSGAARRFLNFVFDKLSPQMDEAVLVAPDHNC